MSRVRGSRIVRYLPFVLLLAALVAGLRYFDILGGGTRGAILLAPIAGARPEAALLTEKLASALTEATAGRERVVLRRLRTSITEEEGSRAARSLGDRERAALVVWGYLKSTGPGTVLMLTIENMGMVRFVILRPFGDYAVEGALADPNQFALRQRFGGDADAPVLLVNAVVRYRDSRDADADPLFAYLLNVVQPGDRAALLLSRANLAVLMAAPDEALKRYDEVLEGRSLAAEAHNGRGLAHALLNNHPLALTEYEAATGLDPEDEAPYLNRGISHTFMGEYQRAIGDYDRALQGSPRAARAIVGRGVSWAALGEHKRAVDNFSRAIGIEPSAAAYLDRGLSRAALGEHRPAIEDFSRALQLRPVDPLILVNRGRSRSILKDQTAAIADFTAALELNPRMAVAYYERGIARTIVGQHQQAVEDFSAAITLNPRYGDAYKGRGISQLLRREYARALEDFEHAIAIDPKDAEAYYQHGITLRLRGEPRKAIPDMEKVLEVSRDPSLRKQAEEQLRQIRAEP